MVWMESDKFSYAEQIERLDEKKEYYTYDFETKKTEKFDIDFESNFEPYKGIKTWTEHIGCFAIPMIQHIIWMP